MRTLRLDREEITDIRVFSGIFFPLLAGCALFGWRTLILVGLVILGAQLARWLMARLLTWPVRLSVLSINIRSMLVAMFLPAALVDVDLNFTAKLALWPIPITIGIVLTIFTWACSRLATARISSVVLTSIFAILISNQFIHSDRVLQRDHIFKGNLLGDRVANRLTSSAEPWLDAPLIYGAEVLQMEAASDQLGEYLGRKTGTKPRTMTISRLISENLPPMEDLVIGGQPAAVGMGSVLTIIIGGLLLVYRRLVAFRVPMLMLAVLLLTMMICPVPVVVSPEESVYRWLAGNDVRVGWATGITFLNYILFSSSALAVIFFLACQPGIRPYRGSAAMIFAIFYGIACGLSILYVSIDYGPLLALLVVQVIAPTLDARNRRRVVASVQPKAIVES